MENLRWTPCNYCGRPTAYMIRDGKQHLMHALPPCAAMLRVQQQIGSSFSVGESEASRNEIEACKPISDSQDAASLEALSFLRNLERDMGAK